MGRKPLVLRCFSELALNTSTPVAFARDGTEIERLPATKTAATRLTKRAFQQLRLANRAHAGASVRPFLRIERQRWQAQLFEVAVVALCR